MELIEDYCNLFCSFVKASGEAALLKSEAIRQEAAETKDNFKKMIAKMDFSDDMPKR